MERESPNFCILPCCFIIMIIIVSVHGNIRMHFLTFLGLCSFVFLFLSCISGFLTDVFWNWRQDWELRRFQRWLDEQLARQGVQEVQEVQEVQPELQVEIFEPPVPTTVIVIQNPDDVSLGIPYKSEIYCIHDGQETKKENV